MSGYSFRLKDGVGRTVDLYEPGDNPESVRDSIRSIEIKLSDGNVIDVELFEKYSGVLTVRSPDGLLEIIPHVSNCVSLRVRVPK